MDGYSGYPKLLVQDQQVNTITLKSSTCVDIESFISKYDFSWQYDSTQTYSFVPYEMLHHGILCGYINYFVVIDDKPLYVVAEKIRSPLSSFEPYCTCLRCMLSKYNPIKYLLHPMITGCIKVGPKFVNTKYVEEAKIIIEKKSTQFVQGMNLRVKNGWIKYVELLGFGILIGLGWNFISRFRLSHHLRSCGGHHFQIDFH